MKKSPAWDLRLCLTVLRDPTIGSFGYADGVLGAVGNGGREQDVDLPQAPLTRSVLTVGQLAMAVRRRERRGVWGCAPKKAR